MQARTTMRVMQARTTMRALRARATALRPAWTIRGFVTVSAGECAVSFSVPAGHASTPEEALEVARKQRRDVMRSLPEFVWRAFPTAGPVPDPSTAFDQARPAG